MSKVLTVCPIMDGSGGKFVSANLAHHLKQETKQSVALVDFNFKHPYLGKDLTDDTIHGIDNLLDKIDGDGLTPELFKENMVTLRNGVDLLQGTNLIGKHHLFQAPHIFAMLEQLKALYDYVVVAVSPQADNAGTIYGVSEADQLILVGRETVANVATFNRTYQMLSQYKKQTTDVAFVYNMKSAPKGLSEYIQDYNLTVLGLVDYDEQAIDNRDLVESKAKLFKSKSKNHNVFTSMVTKVR